jgi:hypothetical protein
MSQRHSGRTQACSEADVTTRLRHAQKFIDVAELVADEGNDLASALRQANDLVEFAEDILRR